MNKIARYLVSAVGLISIASFNIGPAAADVWPVSTKYWTYVKIRANNSSLILQIHALDDATGCVRIAGFLYPTVGANQYNDDKVTGSYCPFNAQLSFLRNDPKNTVTNQVFDGVFTGTGLFTGTFATFGGGDDSGEFPVSGKIDHY
ncbi:hypothetical protein [Methylocella silvestris]|uniref:DUF2141 domain-containing protein n=1 Tax=Methylocella silvestris TaxID=199596 RepID=A0A2J7TKU7_METSI|nr:hypothetical protein [Methylocella silvestris]PNG27391.1 hypothetical protein CR492_00075 [Methylocella silvestris]